MTERRKPSMTIDQIEAAALELGPTQFDELLDRLDSRRPYRSVVSAAWVEEAERRIDLVRAGRMRLYDAEEVLEDPDEDV